MPGREDPTHPMAVDPIKDSLFNALQVFWHICFETKNGTNLFQMEGLYLMPALHLREARPSASEAKPQVYSGRQTGGDRKHIDFVDRLHPGERHLQPVGPGGRGGIGPHAPVPEVLPGPVAVDRAEELLAVRQGFEPVEPRFSKLVMACGFGA